MVFFVPKIVIFLCTNIGTGSMFTGVSSVLILGHDRVHHRVHWLFAVPILVLSLLITC